MRASWVGKCQEIFVCSCLRRFYHASTSWPVCSNEIKRWSSTWFCSHVLFSLQTETL